MSAVYSTVETSGFSPRVPSNCTAGKKFCQSYNSSLKLDTLPVSLMKCDELSLFVPVQKLFSGFFSRSLLLGVIKLDWCNFVGDGKSTGNLLNTYTVWTSWHIPIPPHSCDKFALHFHTCLDRNAEYYWSTYRSNGDIHQSWLFCSYRSFFLDLE